MFLFVATGCSRKAIDFNWLLHTNDLTLLISHWHSSEGTDSCFRRNALCIARSSSEIVRVRVWFPVSSVYITFTSIFSVPVALINHGIRYGAVSEISACLSSWCDSLFLNWSPLWLRRWSWGRRVHFRFRDNGGVGRIDRRLDEVFSDLTTLLKLMVSGVFSRRASWGARLKFKLHFRENSVRDGRASIVFRRIFRWNCTYIKNFNRD